MQHHRRADVTRKSQLEPQLTKFSAQMTETALGGADPPACRVLAIDTPRTTASEDIHYFIVWSPDVYPNRIVSYVPESALVTVLRTAGIQHLVRTHAHTHTHTHTHTQP